MDLATLIASIAAIPGVGPYMVWITFALTTGVTLCSILATQMPAPTVRKGWYYWAYTIVNLIALARGHAVNLSAPSSAGIVGGPTAISAPQIAVKAVPKAAAALSLILLLILTSCALPVERGARWHPDPHWGDRGLRRY